VAHVTTSQTALGMEETQRWLEAGTLVVRRTFVPTGDGRVHHCEERFVADPTPPPFVPKADGGKQKHLARAKGRGWVVPSLPVSQFPRQRSVATPQAARGAALLKWIAHLPATRSHKPQNKTYPVTLTLALPLPPPQSRSSLSLSTSFSISHSHSLTHHSPAPPLTPPPPRWAVRTGGGQRLTAAQLVVNASFTLSAAAAAAGPGGANPNPSATAMGVQ
jgi:hypothetical protein